MVAVGGSTPHGFCASSWDGSFRNRRSERQTGSSPGFRAAAADRFFSPGCPGSRSRRGNGDASLRSERDVARLPGKAPPTLSRPEVPRSGGPPSDCPLASSVARHGPGRPRSPRSSGFAVLTATVPRHRPGTMRGTSSNRARRASVAVSFVDRCDEVGKRGARDTPAAFPDPRRRVPCPSPGSRHRDQARHGPAAAGDGQAFAACHSIQELR